MAEPQRGGEAGTLFAAVSHPCSVTVGASLRKIFRKLTTKLRFRLSDMGCIEFQQEKRRRCTPCHLRWHQRPTTRRVQFSVAPERRHSWRGWKMPLGDAAC